jgi:hypothetical protein
MLETIYKTKWCSKPDHNQKLHHCENLKSRKILSVFIISYISVFVKHEENIKKT